MSNFFWNGLFGKGNNITRYPHLLIKFGWGMLMNMDFLLGVEYEDE